MKYKKYTYLTPCTELEFPMRYGILRVSENSPEAWRCHSLLCKVSIFSCLHGFLLKAFQLYTEKECLFSKFSPFLLVIGELLMQ
uniref:Uncharacterized protein n=1 Tax=Pyxicephalus adspersus TaxID=30357 RepID=A0AAV3ALX9_PYXAD|nr:TPA: hypothetical protein GDO54_000238 [Pyxicephalus adspersus]